MRVYYSSVIDHRWRQNVLEVSVSLMFLPHFDVFCDILLNRPTTTWNLFVLSETHMSFWLYTLNWKEKTPINIPALNRLNIRWFVPVQTFLNPKRWLSSLLLLFFFILFVNSSFETFFNVFTCSKQNYGENILQNSESLVAMTQGGNCCEVFLRFRHSQVVKNSPWLRFSIFLLCE